MPFKPHQRWRHLKRDCVVRVLASTPTEGPQQCAPQPGDAGCLPRWRHTLGAPDWTGSPIPSRCLRHRRRTDHPGRPTPCRRLRHDPNDPISRLVFTVLSMIAELRRTSPGLHSARHGGRDGRGPALGKQPNLEPESGTRVQRWNDGTHTAAELADLFRYRVQPQGWHSLRLPIRRRRPAWRRQCRMQLMGAVHTFGVRTAGASSR
jgi:hypothetical protein